MRYITPQSNHDFNLIILKATTTVFVKARPLIVKIMPYFRSNEAE